MENLKLIRLGMEELITEFNALTFLDQLLFLKYKKHLIKLENKNRLFRVRVQNIEDKELEKELNRLIKFEYKKLKETKTLIHLLELSNIC